MEPQRIAYSVKDRLARTRYYMGGYWTFLATGADTAGQFSLIEMNLRKGLEPPRHTHTFEDESFHVLEGEVIYTIGEEVHHAQAGDFVHIPRGITHSFKLVSDKAKVLAHLVPAGLEEMFIQISQPADAIDFPPMPAGPPSPDLLEKIKSLQQKYGIVGIDNTKIKAL